MIGKLSSKGIICNVTAIFTLDQVKKVLDVLDISTPAILSIFAGRIADTGTDPSKIISEALELSKKKSKTEILWASTRETLNIYQADSLGCQIITVPHEILKKFFYLDRDLEKFSLETVEDL